MKLNKKIKKQINLISIHRLPKNYFCVNFSAVFIFSLHIIYQHAKSQKIMYIKNNQPN